MAISDRKKWNSKYAVPDDRPPAAPDWLTRHLSILPRGLALDIATGRGSAAIQLAIHGWQVTALDVSDVGIQHAAKAARRVGANIQWIVADLDNFVLPTHWFDLITVFYFLERHHLPQQLIRALRPGGCLLYETFTVSQLCVPGNRLTNPDHLLGPGELLGMFHPLPVQTYREIALADRAVASLITAPRPSSNA